MSNETTTERVRPVTFHGLPKATMAAVRAEYPLSGMVVVPDPDSPTHHCHVQFNGHGTPEQEDAAITRLADEYGYEAEEGGAIISALPIEPEGEGLAFSRDLLEQALRSMSEECFDETDKALLEQIKHAFPLKVMLHLQPEGWLEFVLNHLPGIMNYSAHVQVKLDGGYSDPSLDSEEGKEFVANVLKELSMSEEAKNMKKLALSAVVGMYQMFFRSFKRGLAIGWRAHEIATLSQSERSSSNGKE